MHELHNSVCFAFLSATIPSRRFFRRLRTKKLLLKSIIFNSILKGMGEKCQSGLAKLLLTVITIALVWTVEQSGNMSVIYFRRCVVTKTLLYKYIVFNIE